MKVALVMYFINNIGGILNHTESLGDGFKKLGHEVHLVQLSYQTRFVKNSRSATREDWLSKPGAEMSVFGMPVSQEFGWYDEPWVNKFAYKGADNVKRVKDFLSSMDLIVWTWPVPTRQKGNIGNVEWMELYDVPTKQVAIIHDDNFRNSYPWINEIKSHIKGLACAHPAAYYDADAIDLPRAMILNPQNMDVMSLGKNWEDRTDGFLSLQTFKGCKHVDHLIRAIPYMKNYRKIVGGGGLEYSYMVSENKTKDIYFLNKKSDPDLPDDLEEKHIRIFDYAEQHGMEWTGYINNNQRDEYLREVKFLIDPSHTPKRAGKENVLNRVILDAMMQGAIPIAKNLGIADNEEGESLIMKPGKNYLMIPYNVTPKVFAEYVDEYMNISKADADEIRFRNNDIVKNFDNKIIAQQFIDLADGKPCGYFNKLETGTLLDTVKEKSTYYINEFFRNINGNAQHMR